jgi:hypothetical protein
MANSTQVFRGRYITLNDRSLLAVIALLQQLEARQSTKKFSGMLEQWYAMLERSGPGTIDLKLDELLIEDQDIDLFEDKLRHILRDISEMGAKIPANLLNDATLPTEIVFKDFPSHTLNYCIVELIELIEGKNTE